MITDAELLAAVRAAGPPGSESHRLACRLYRRSVLEWQADAGRQAERATRAMCALLVAVLAEAARSAGWLSECGTHNGYNQHAYDKTRACDACLKAEREYSRERRRAQRLARAQGKRALREAA